MCVCYRLRNAEVMIDVAIKYTLISVLVRWDESRYADNEMFRKSGDVEQVLLVQVRAESGQWRKCPIGVDVVKQCGLYERQGPT